MPNLYTYTLLKQDGTAVKQVGVKKKSLYDLYAMLKCNTIEIVPRVYYQNKKWGRCIVFADEEGRFNKDKTRNPHFDVLAPGYDIVGDCLREEVYHV